MGSRGFTLIELLVVMAIMALLAAVAVSRRPSAPGFGREKYRIALEHALRDAREQAAISGQAVMVDPATLKGAPAVIAFHPTIGSAHVLLVQPDGSSNGGLVRIGQQELPINWLDTRIAYAR